MEHRFQNFDTPKWKIGLLVSFLQEKYMSLRDVLSIFEITSFNPKSPKINN